MNVLIYALVADLRRGQAVVFSAATNIPGILGLNVQNWDTDEACALRNHRLGVAEIVGRG